jgi:hypothetical protein
VAEGIGGHRPAVGDGTGEEIVTAVAMARRFSLAEQRFAWSAPKVPAQGHNWPLVVELSTKREQRAHAKRSVTERHRSLDR